MALGLHERSVESRLGVALGLRTHPLLAELLHDGGLGVPHALAALDEVICVSEVAVADRVLHQVLAAGGPDGAPGWSGTPSQLRAALRSMVARLDPQAAARRAEQGAARTGVRLRDLTDGLCEWTATGPAAQLVAADRLLDTLAGPDGPDDARSRGQRQVDALLGALLTRAGVGVPLELQLEIPVRTGVAAVLAPAGPAGALPEPVVIRADLDPSLLAVLTGSPTPSPPGSQTSPPASAPVPTPVPAPPALVPAPPAPVPAPPAPVPAPVVVPVPDAGVLAGGGLDVDGAGGSGQVPALQPPASRRRHRLRGGVTEIEGVGPVDPAWLGGLLADPAGLPVGLAAVRVRRLLVDRTGQVVGVDATAVPLASLLAGGTRSSSPASTLRRNDGTGGAAPSMPGGPGSNGPGSNGPATDGPGSAGDGDAGALLRTLLADLPPPPARTEAYQPAADQQRTVKARDTRCCFPGCRQRARRSELDHRHEFPAGPTSTANLHPLCKHHHRLKHDGWHPHRHPDGTTTWTSPRGQTHTTAPP